MTPRSILASLLPTPRRLKARPTDCAKFRPWRAALAVETLEDRTVPSTFTVLNLADGGGGSLRQAVLDANSLPGADTVVFAEGVSGTIGLTTGQLSITDLLTIDGPGAGQLTVSGSAQSRIFNIGGGTAVAIAGLTITGGRAVGDGGGILNTGGMLSLENVILSGNHAVALAGNVNGRGGAVANLFGATLSVIGCQVTDNQARGADGGLGNGGGIFNFSSRLALVSSTFWGNQAVGGGGGGQALGGGLTSAGNSTATITDCTFLGNQAVAGDGGTGTGFGRGGGIANNASHMTVENSQILNNVARGGSGSTRPGPRTGFASGGGITSADAAATLVLTGSTVRGNLAIGGDGNTCTGGNAFVGTALGGGLSNVGTATLTDCLFEGNEARGGSGNRGDGAGHQLVGTGLGGGIAATAGDPTGTPSRLTLRDVTVRHNRAVGGDGNTAATLSFVGAGVGGGVLSDGSNNNVPLPSGCITNVWDTTVAFNEAVGGIGGVALGGGVANVLGSVFTISDSKFTDNRAHGGEGHNGFGGGIYNGATSTHSSNFGAPTVLTVQDSKLAHNMAWGGDGGDGAGGGVWNGGTASIVDTAINCNLALGGDGLNGSAGGNGFGGGAFNDAAASLLLEECTLTENHARGGDEGGEGTGGGVYNVGDFDFDELTLIFDNHSSTSHNDVFEL